MQHSLLQRVSHMGRRPLEQSRYNVRKLPIRRSEPNRWRPVWNRLTPSSSAPGLWVLRPRGVALGRKAWLFAGSSRGGDRAAFMYSLIITAKMNDVDPQAWLADVLARLPDMPLSRLPELLPWNWPRTAQRIAA